VSLQGHWFSSRSLIFSIVNQHVRFIGWHASLQTGESRVLRAEVMSYFRVNRDRWFASCKRNFSYNGASHLPLQVQLQSLRDRSFASCKQSLRPNLDLRGERSAQPTVGSRTASFPPANHLVPPNHLASARPPNQKSRSPPRDAIHVRGPHLIFPLPSLPSPHHIQITHQRATDQGDTARGRSPRRSTLRRRAPLTGAHIRCGPSNLPSPGRHRPGARRHHHVLA
jgi:hypothetical protein